MGGKLPCRIYPDSTYLIRQNTELIHFKNYNHTIMLK